MARRSQASSRDRRSANAEAMGAFGAVDLTAAPGSPGLRAVIEATKGKRKSPTLFTIGYERRLVTEMAELLAGLGVRHLADIRQRPTSRRAEFRAGPLRSRIEAAGIAYGPWPELGSTDEQRERVKRTADFEAFHASFRQYAARHLAEPLDRLADAARLTPVALLCYERAHEECHRMVVAELVALRLGCAVVAIT